MTSSQKICSCPELLLYTIKLVLEIYGISKNHVIFCLVFGSRAHGYEKIGSDIDLLVVLQEQLSSHTQLGYRKLDVKGVKVDANCMSLKQLDEKCADPAWAYRIYRAQPVFPYMNISEDCLNLWLKRLNHIIKSEPSTLFRCQTHLQDIHKLKALLRFCTNEYENLFFYLLSETIYLMSFIVLELSGRIPFSEIPLNLSVERVAKTKNQKHIQCFFNTLMYIKDNIISHHTSNSLSIQELRLRCLEGRAVVESVFPESKGLDQKYLVSHDWNHIKCLGKVFTEKYPYAMNLNSKIFTMINDFIKLVKIEMSLEISSHDYEYKVSKTNTTKDDIIRHISYDSQAKRLKAIIPTGGCTYSNCTFCMLPTFAKKKANIKEVAELLLQHTKAPVEQLTIYTDGSFFDNKELNTLDRNVLADVTYKLQPKELLIESLPRFIEVETLHSFVERLHPNCHLKIAIGLQSTNDEIRKYITRTPITSCEFKRAAKLCQKTKTSLRIYLLLGKPFLSIWEDIEDVKTSVVDLAELLTPEDTITINPLLTTTGTFMETIHNSGFFEYIKPNEISYAIRMINKLDVPQRIEFGTIQRGTCSSNHIKSEKEEEPSPTIDEIILSSSQQIPEVDVGTWSLPWRLLGPYKNRIVWFSSIVK